MTQTSVPGAGSAPCLGAGVTADPGSTGPAGKCQPAVCAVTQRDHNGGPGGQCFPGGQVGRPGRQEVTMRLPVSETGPFCKCHHRWQPLCTAPGDRCSEAGRRGRQGCEWWRWDRPHGSGRRCRKDGT